MTVRVVDGPEQDEVDGFEFGTETLTLQAPGRYRVEVAPVDATSGAPSNFLMSRRSIPLQVAQLWHRAEISATVSKRTKKTQDIVVSLSLWRDLGELSAIARTELKHGDASMADSDSLGARTKYEEALQACSSMADLRCAAEAANNSGYVSFLLGDLEASSHRLNDAAGVLAQSIYAAAPRTHAFQPGLDVLASRRLRTGNTVTE
ncbi:MAG: hypothetical protein WDO73_26355 [Ignavibacteriota bacterium]